MKPETHNVGVIFRDYAYAKETNSGPYYWRIVKGQGQQHEIVRSAVDNTTEEHPNATIYMVMPKAWVGDLINVCGLLNDREGIKS
jgi:hypothetical protein